MIEATTSSVRDSFGAAEPSTTKGNGADTLGIDTFLQLMTTQRRNQDPSAPQDSSEFLAQLAQFSSLTGIQSIDQSISGAVAGLKADRLLQASAMIGKQVLARTDLLVAKQSPSALTGQVNLPADTANLRIHIHNDAGQTVRTLVLGPQAQGAHEFAWDGLDTNGNTLPGGSYRLVPEVAETTGLQAPLASLW